MDSNQGPFIGSQTEDGFTYTVTSGLNFTINAQKGNPASSLGVGFVTIDGPQSNPVVTGGQIEFTRTGGGLFTFDSFQLANQLFGISRGISWTGQVNGVDTQSLTGVSTNSSTFSTQNVNFSGAIDKLILTFTDLNEEGLFLDNLQFTPAQEPPATTPEPVTILGLVTVGALGALSRKRQK